MTDLYFSYYGSEEVVCVGDRVIVEGRWYGVVQDIALPGSSMADLMQTPDGGVLFGVNEQGVMTLSFICPDDGSERPGWYSAWKATKFLHRGSIIELPLGVGTVAWPYEPGPYAGGLAPKES